MKIEISEISIFSKFRNFQFSLTFSKIFPEFFFDLKKYCFSSSYHDFYDSGFMCTLPVPYTMSCEAPCEKIPVIPKSPKKFQIHKIEIKISPRKNKKCHPDFFSWQDIRGIEVKNPPPY